MIISFNWIVGMCLGFEFLTDKDGEYLAVDLLIARILFHTPNGKV